MSINSDLWPMGTKVTYMTPHQWRGGEFIRSEEIEAQYIGGCRGKQNRHAIEIMKDGRSVRRYVSSFALRRTS